MTTLLRMPEVARRLGVHRANIYRMVASGALPPPVRLSGAHGQHGGVVAWPEDEIELYGNRLIAERNAHEAARPIPRKPAKRKK